MFLAEIRNAASKTKTVEDSYSAGNGDTIIVDSAVRAGNDTLNDYLPGFAVTLSATPSDGDTVRIIVKGYGHLTNAVSVRASHPIDFRTTGVVPDGTYVNTFLGDNKTLVLDDKNLETLFVYDGTNSRWDSNTSSAASNLNYRRLRPSETEMATNNVQLVTCDFQPAMWDNPYNYDTVNVAQEAVYGWSAPTACSNYLGFIENRYGPFSTFGDGADYPSTGIYVQGDAQWLDHCYDAARPANTVTHATQASGAVTDFGWYIGTNGTGAADCAALNAAVTYGTSIGNFVLGFRAWLNHIGEGALQATDASISYNTQDIFPDPLANEGYASTLMENFDTNFQTVRDEIANNRPFFACFRHWNITEKTTPANKLAPETVGGASLCKSLPIKFYNWGTLTTSGPNNENYYVGGVDDFEDSVGHWALVVGYIETGAGYATNANYTIHPHISPSSKYLIVIDELYSAHSDLTPNGISTLNGIDQRHLKAIPIIENGVTTNRANLLATFCVQITNATFAA